MALLKVVKKQAKGYSNGLMGLNTKEIGIIINKMVVVHINGKMVQSIKVNGLTESCMGLACKNGQMDNIMRDYM